MIAKNTIVINGKVYDTVTGLPVAMPAAPKRSTTSSPSTHTGPSTIPKKHHKPATSHHHAAAAHPRLQRSHTLRRDVVKKPAGNPKATAGSLRHKPSTTVDQSPHIKHFAPHPQSFGRRADIMPIKSRQAKPAVSSIVAQKHRIVASHSAPVVKPAALSSRSVKEQVTAQRMTHAVTTHGQPHTTKKRGLFSARPRALSVASAMITVMVLGGYLTYLNMPGLSVRVAASQAGIAANYPDYRPDGYRFSGPVAFAEGQVAMKFQSNGNNASYTVTQQKSAWDSQAVHDNLVASTAGEDYVTNSQQGLTIYTFKNNAAWVNRGILFTVTGNAPLSNEQLLRIAGSM